jgi:hypothetical protein
MANHSTISEVSVTNGVSSSQPSVSMIDKSLAAFKGHPTKPNEASKVAVIANSSANNKHNIALLPTEQPVSTQLVTDNNTAILPVLLPAEVTSLAQANSHIESNLNTANFLVPVQEETHINAPSVYLSVMPLLTYHDLSGVPTNEHFNVKDIKSQASISAARVGLQLRGGMELSIARKLSLRAGVTYSRLTQRLEYKYDNFDKTYFRTNGEKVIPEDKDAKNQHLEVLGLQLGLKYDFKTKGATVHSLIGSVESAAQIHLYDDGSKPSPLAKDALSFAYISYRRAHKMTETAAIWVEPTFQIPLSHYLDNDQRINIKPYSLGINIGISWSPSTKDDEILRNWWKAQAKYLRGF